MAILRAKEVVKMDRKARDEKLLELKKELVKANVTANRTNAKTKEIKKAIARIITFNTEEIKSQKGLKSK